MDFICRVKRMKDKLQQQQQPLFHGHYTGQPVLAGTSS